MRQRAFLALVGGGSVWPFAARADELLSLPRIGYLSLGTATDPRAEGEFLAGLRNLGYVEGKTIEIEFRFTSGDPDEVCKAAVDLVKAKVDTIVAYATGVYAARHATSTIPIVMAAAGDVIAMGLAASLAASLAHAGGNVTGSNFFLPELMAKRLGLIKEVLPAMSSARRPFRRGVASTPNILEAMRAAGKTLGVTLSPIEISGPEEFERAFATWTEQTVGAVVVVDIFSGQSPAIAAIAAKRRIASIGSLEWAAGGLIGCGVDFPAMFRRTAYFVDKILKGAKPGDIPIELATKFQTAVNLKTAKTLGIDIPPTVLASADEVIE